MSFLLNNRLPVPQCFGPSLWWDGSNPGNNQNALSDATVITTLKDKSGLGNDATQATPANKPLYRTNRRNGLGALNFSGTQIMATAAAPTGMTFGDTPRTVFIAGSFVGNPAGTNQNFWQQYPGGAGGFTFAHFAAGGATLGLDSGGGGFITTSPYAVATGGTFVWNYSNAGGNFLNATIKVNGAAQSITGHAYAFTTGPLSSVLTIGAGGPSKDLYEVLYFDRQLSAADNACVETYLRNKWNL